MLNAAPHRGRALSMRSGTHRDLCYLSGPGTGWCLNSKTCLGSLSAMSPGWHPEIPSKVSKSVNSAQCFLDDKPVSLGRVKMAEMEHAGGRLDICCLHILLETQCSVMIKHLKYLTPLSSWDPGYCHSAMSWFFVLEFNLQILKIFLPAKCVKEIVKRQLCGVK